MMSTKIFNIFKFTFGNPVGKIIRKAVVFQNFLAVKPMLYFAIFTYNSAAVPFSQR